MRAVNLLPRDLERQPSERGRVPLLVLAGGIGAVTALALLLYFPAAGAVSERKGDLEAAQGALAVVAPTTEPSSSQDLVAQERADRVAALSAALSSRVPVDLLLRQLSYVLPSDVWLTGLQAAADESSPKPASAPPSSSSSSSSSSGSSPTTPASTASASKPSGGTSITIDGATYTQDSVARLLARLAILPSLENVQLTKSERVVPESAAAASAGSAGGAKPAPKPKQQKAVVTFEISATYAGGRS